VLSFRVDLKHSNCRLQRPKLFDAHAQYLRATEADICPK
jgi:hypothetical protein